METEDADSNHSGLITFAIINALLGLIVFEWAWYTTRRLRNPIHELNAQFPELCRPDAPRWWKWKHYPGAMTMMLPRFVLLLLLGPLLALCIKICMCCHDRNKPMNVVRRWLCRTTFNFFIFIMGMFGWFTYFGHEYKSQESVRFY